MNAEITDRESLDNSEFNNENKTGQGSNYKTIISNDNHQSLDLQEIHILSKEQMLESVDDEPSLQKCTSSPSQKIDRSSAPNILEDMNMQAEQADRILDTDNDTPDSWLRKCCYDEDSDSWKFLCCSCPCDGDNV